MRLLLLATILITQVPAPTPSPRWRTVFVRLNETQWNALKLAAGDTSVGYSPIARRAVEARVNDVCQLWFDEAIEQCAINDTQKILNEAEYCRNQELPPDCLQQTEPQ